jgi:hypothetical protein
MSIPRHPSAGWDLGRLGGALLTTIPAFAGMTEGGWDGDENTPPRKVTRNQCRSLAMAGSFAVRMQRERFAASPAVPRCSGRLALTARQCDDGRFEPIGTEIEMHIFGVLRQPARTHHHPRASSETRKAWVAQRANCYSNAPESIENFVPFPIMETSDRLFRSLHPICLA